MQTRNRSRDELIKKWESKAREVYSESLKLVREGFHGLEIMAGKTMEVTRIKMANQKSLHSIRTLFTELGQRVFDSVRNANKGVIRVTPDISSFADQIRRLQSAIEDNLDRLKQTSMVKEKPKKSKVVKKRKTTRRAPTKKK